MFSDLHLHEFSYGSKIVEGRNSRLEQQIRAVHQITDYCRANGIREAVLTGDVFHASTITAAVSEGAFRSFRSFADAGINLTVVPGNHDQAGRTGNPHALSWFSTIGQLVYGSVGEILSIGNVQAEGIPFIHDRDTLARRLEQVRDETRLLFLHQGVGGVEINSKGFTLNEALTSDMIPPTVAMAFTGHYHSAKRVSPNLIIPGSTVQLNWGDTGESRGWLDVEYNTEDNTVEIMHCESKASKFVQIHSPAELPNDQIAGNFIRLVTDDHNASFVEDAARELTKAGAESVEVKTVIQLDKNVQQVETKQFNSLNEVIYAYASSKLRQGVIDEFDFLIGEQIMKGVYQVPNV